MKQIGIKLADGSFYPIMEDGQVSSKKLGLTTVRDNQTRIVVDLYRSKTGTMEDAEYIDSLQIDNLNAHPNGSVDIPLNIKLDENNKLSADMVDPETGATSNADITLVSRTLEERLEPTNYNVKMDSEGNLTQVDEPEITDAETETFDLPEENSDLTNENIDSFVQDEENDFDIPEAVDLNNENEEPELNENEELNSENNEKTNSGAAAGVAAGIAAGAAGGGLLARMMAKRQEEEEKAENEEKTEALSDAMASKADALKGMGDEPEYESAENPAAGTLDDSLDFDLPDFSDEPASETSENRSENAFDETALPESNEISDDTTVPSDDDFGLPDFGDSSDSENTFASETETPSDDDFTLPDFGDSDTTDETAADTSDTTMTADTPAEDKTQIDNPALGNYFDEQIPSSDETKTEENGFADLDLPDFPEENTDTEMNDDDFLNTISETDQERNNPDSFAAAETAAVAGAGLDFDGLYDKETEEGSSYKRDDNDDDVKKKTKAPVIICIICAIICVIAVLLLLFVVPSKYNLLGKRKAEAPVQAVEVTEKTEPVEEPVSEPEPEPEIEAKEDEIVVITEPEIVETVEPEKPAEPEKPKDITYKIKWGDTLWDIADAYYKNPWRYHMIANYNGIKNPDYIISGTTIKLPQK